ncbi:Nucleoporin GLE1 [Hordeum vulgare]|nr:Nucleoporin GLE1 [Hordeum vulgare]
MTRHFTLTHCWSLTKDCPKFSDQYLARKKKGGKAAVAAEGDLLKRPRGKTSSKADEKHDASSMDLQRTLENMMSQKELQMEEVAKKRKLDMEEVAKKRKLDMEEVVEFKNLKIEATNADTEAKEAALAIMSVDKNMTPKGKA